MEWTEVLNKCLDIILPAVASVVTVIAGVIATKIKAKYEQKVNDETTQKVISEVVQFVQQVYKDLDGAEKLQKAIEQASIILQEKGIKVTEAEINMLIESAVFGMKQAIASNTTVLEVPGQVVQALDSGDVKVENNTEIIEENNTTVG